MFQYMLTVSTVLGDTLVVLISIILLLFLVKYFAWDKIEAMLEARRQKISKDLDEAEKKRKAAEEIQANAKEIIHVLLYVQCTPLLMYKIHRLELLL